MLDAYKQRQGNSERNVMKLTSAGLLLILAGATMSLFVDFKPGPAYAANQVNAQIAN
jgi:hypothetical protein